jgi:PadR family transcriptional regulator, regulatory protein PadR
MKDPGGHHYGYDTSKATGCSSPTVYRTLARLVKRGWLTDGWEPMATGRPTRRYYQVTERGRQEMAELLGLLP